MNQMKAPAAILASVLLLVVNLACHRQNAEWKGTVEFHDGIKIINDPKSPIYNSPQFVLTEDLSIGGIEKGDDSLFFQNILPYNSISVDNQGDIYIVDEKACQIVMVDNTGQLIKKIGRPGQGPGEFQLPDCINILADGNISVYDSINRRISNFSSKGDLIQELNLASHPELFTPQIGADGTIIGATMDLGPHRVISLMVISADGKSETKIETFNSRPVFDGKTIDLFVPNMEFRISRQNEIVWGVQNKFVLNISDRTGALKEQIIKMYDPVPLGAKDVEARVQAVFRGRGVPTGVKIDAPSFYLPFSTVLLGDDGWIFVRTNEKSNDGSYIFDVFDAMHRFHSRISIKGTTSLISKGHLYSIEENKEGAIFVKRYKMTFLGKN